MQLREKVKALSGNKRRFILLKVADLDTKTALKLVGVNQGTYNTWCQQEAFVSVHREVRDLSYEFKQEAIQLLRRDNQLDAVLLEGRIIRKMREELETGQYEILKSNLAKDVYNKLIADLDAVPHTQVFTWEQRLNQMRQGDVIFQEGVIDGEISEEAGFQSLPTQGKLIKEGEQEPSQVEEEAQE